MKPNVVLTKATLLGALAASLLFINACQKETDPLPGPVEDTDILALAGMLHNDMITYYFANRQEGTENMDGSLSEMIGLSCEYLNQLGYDPEMIRETKLRVENAFQTTYLKGTSPGKLQHDIAGIMEQISATGLYGKHFQQEIRKMLKLVKKQDDRVVVKKYVDNTFARIDFKKNHDRKGQQIFVDIFTASYAFWEAYETNNLKGAPLKPSSWVIINDGIGGVLGMVFGPLGSIVTATVFSLGTNQEI